MAGFNPPSPFEMAANQFTNPSQTPDYEFAAANMADSQSLAGELGQAQQPQEPAISHLSLDYGKDGKGTVNVKMSQAAAQTLQEMLQQAQTTNKATDLLIRQYASKRDVLQNHPILAQLGRYASLGATAYQAPNSRGEGLVRAAGAYGGEYFKDTPDELQAKIAGAERSKMENIFPIQQAISQDRRLNEAEARSQRMENIAKEELRIKQLDQFNKDFDIPASAGKYTPGSYTKAAETAIKQGLTTPAEVARYETSLRDRAQAARDEDIRKETQARETRRQAENLQSSLAAKERAARSHDTVNSALLGKVTTLDENIVTLNRMQENARSTLSSLANEMGKPVPKTRAEAQEIVNQALQKAAKDAATMDPSAVERLNYIRKTGAEAISNFDNSTAIKGYTTAREAAVKNMGKEWSGLAGAPPESAPEAQGPAAPPPKPLTEAEIAAMDPDQLTLSWINGLMPGVTKQQLEAMVQQKTAKANQQPSNVIRDMPKSEQFFPPGTWMK